MILDSKWDKKQEHQLEVLHKRCQIVTNLGKDTTIAQRETESVIDLMSALLMIIYTQNTIKTTNSYKMEDPSRPAAQQSLTLISNSRLHQESMETHLQPLSQGKHMAEWK